MQSSPYQFSTFRPDLAEAPAPQTVTLREIPEAHFHELTEGSGAPCADMYGDLPYGLFSLPNAIIRGEAGYIFTQAGRPILEQNASFLRKRKFLRHRFETITDHIEPPQQTDELISLLSSCHSYFWHWMMDSLPKVFLAEEAGFKGSYLLPAKAKAPWAAESLELLGVSSDRVRHYDDSDLRVRLLYVPTYFCGYNAHHNAPFIRRFREKLLACSEGIVKNRKERILIGRRETAKVRRLLNQEVIADALIPFGFRVAYLEDLSLRAQIALARSAEIVIGSHGSGLTHALFMNEASFVIELFPFGRKQSNDCYETLSSIVNHRYLGLASDHDREGDIEVAPQRIIEALS